MGNELQKQYNIRQKPLKLPGSYQFLRFIHHPQEDLSLIIVKSPHRATPIPSTLILPIKQVRPLSQSNDTLAICHKCLPLCLVKPKSETQLRILMHKILKSSAQIGRCFFYLGRVMLWCEEKRGLSSISPQELQYGKSHQKSKVFTSGISLINFLHCVYENESILKKDDKKSKKESNKTLYTTKDKVRQKLKQKASLNESLPQQIKLLFEPKDKKEYYQNLYSMDTKLKNSCFWGAISEGLRQLLLNMVNEDPQKRIDLQQIINITYFMESNQLRLYSTLTDDLQMMSPREAKIFMTTLQIIIKEGLTIQSTILEEFFRPVLTSMVTYNPSEGKDTDYITALVLSILMQFDKPSTQIIYQGYKKSHPKNTALMKLALGKKLKLFNIMSNEQFDFIISRAIFCGFESQTMIQHAVLSIPFAIKNIKQANYKKEIQYQLIHRILVYPVDKLKDDLLLDALKCMIYLVREQLVSSPQKLQILVFPPHKLNIQLNYHVLYLYGLMIECFQPQELIDKMMPKLQLYLNDLQIYDEIFVVAKRCVDRILERLYEQRKIKRQQLQGLNKEQDYFDMRNDPSLVQPDIQTTKLILKKQIEKHEIQKLKWTFDIL